MADQEYLIIDKLSNREFRRIFSRISIDPITECWNWNGFINAWGYGDVWFRNTMERVHRILYTYLVQPIPKGIPITRFIQLHHKCNNPRYCNPTHLQLVTNRENVLAGNGPTAINSRKEYCKKGHKLPADRNRTGKSGRYCRICDSIRKKLRKQGPQREYWLNQQRETNNRFRHKFHTISP